MENKMDKKLTFDIDDIEKVNLLIGKTDPRIERILKQFAGDDKDLLEIFKLKAAILLEFNKPFWAQTRQMKQTQTENKSMIYLIKRKGSKQNQYRIFEAREQDNGEPQPDKIFCRAWAIYTPNTPNGPCISDLEIFSCATAIGYWDTGTEVAPEEAAHLFKMAIKARKGEPV